MFIFVYIHTHNKTSKVEKGIKNTAKGSVGEEYIKQKCWIYAIDEKLICKT